MLEELLQLSSHFLQLKNQDYKRYFIKQHPFVEHFSVLLGGRGIGKTTTLIQNLLQKADGNHLSHEILYVQADHFITKQSSLYSIADEFNKFGGKYLAFDEIHKYANWSQELKSICDTFPNLIITASGSSALQIHRGSHDLSRRAILYHMYGLSFREFLELDLNISLKSHDLADILKHHIAIADEIRTTLKKNGCKILRKFSEYCQYGYYPYFRELNEKNNYLITLEQNVHTTIESDLVAIYPALTGLSIRKIKQLFEFIAQQVPFTINWSNIGKATDIKDLRTLKNYFQYLESAELIKLVGKNGNKLNKLEQPEKIYLQNPNLYYAVNTKINSGTIREIFFLSMLEVMHKITLASPADFVIDDRYTIEIGGKKKGNKQIINSKDSYIASDSLEIGINNKIPLWLFGFLY